MRWAVWPIWHAKGGLEGEELKLIPLLLSAGMTERVCGGMTIRPTSADSDAESACSEKAACMTISPSGRALATGIALLRKLLINTVFRAAT